MACPISLAAYGVNIGLWDKVAINYGYRQFSDPAAERAGLEAILSDATKSGLVYITDEDARPPGSAHPFAHLWDNGTDAADELTRIMKIRNAALARFGENAIPAGAPLATLEDTLVPLYLMHRYQTEAATKIIGGLDYRYQLRGDGQMNAAIVSRGRTAQGPASGGEHACRAQTLTLPESLLKLFPPRPPDFERTPRVFARPHRIDVRSDCRGRIRGGSDFARFCSIRERAARLVEYHARANTLSLAK